MISEENQIEKLLSSIQFKDKCIEAEFNRITIGEWSFSLPSIAIDLYEKALNSFILTENASIFKQLMYDSALCRLIDFLRFQNHGHNSPFSSGISCMWIPYFSDNIEIIQFYSEYNLMYFVPKKSLESQYYYNWVLAYQSIYKNDTDLLKFATKNLRNEADKKYRSLRCEVDCFEAIIEKNIKKFELGLEGLIKLEIKDNRNIIYGNILAPRAMGMNKLAIYAGLDYYHNSHFTPKELIKIDPLDKYDTHHAAIYVMNGYEMSELYERFINDQPFDQLSEIKRIKELNLIEKNGIFNKAKHFFKK